MSYQHRGLATARAKEKAIQNAQLKQGTRAIMSFFIVLSICAYLNSLLL